jgi:ferredoxin
LQLVNVVFIAPDQTRIEVSGTVGSTLLEVAHANKIEIEGACGGECACSTCHVILDENSFEKLPEISLEEEDMLDLAHEVTDL